jgi:hypothetical protein
MTGLIIAKFTLVPTVRGLYLFAFVMMTIKALTTNAMVTETERGRIRLQETRGQPLFAVLREYPDVLKKIVRAPATLYAAGLILIVGIYRMVQRTFWSILVTEKLQIPPQHLAYFPFVRSMTILLFFFLVMPRLRNMDVRKPMILGFLGLIVGNATLIIVPPKNYALLLVATFLEACSVPVATTLLEKLVVLVVEAQERARIMAILYVIVMVFTSPFGWIAGRISEIDRSLPFVLSIALFAVGVLLTYLASRAADNGVKIGEMAKEAAEA